MGRPPVLAFRLHYFHSPAHIFFYDLFKDKYDQTIAGYMLVWPMLGTSFQPLLLNGVSPSDPQRLLRLTSKWPSWVFGHRAENSDPHVNTNKGSHLMAPKLWAIECEIWHPDPDNKHTHSQKNKLLFAKKINCPEGGEVNRFSQWKKKITGEKSL